MSIVGTLIDKARVKSGIGSDNQLAFHFGVHRQAVSKWRNEEAYPDEEHIAALATMAGEDPVQWLVAIKAVRSNGAAGKAWAALAKRLGAATAVLLVTAGFLGAEPAQASTQQARSTDQASCIMRNELCLEQLPQPATAST